MAENSGNGNGRRPDKIINLGKWSIAIFSQGDRTRGYSTNLRKNLTQEELKRAENRPESLVIHEEELPAVQELTRLAFSWISERKIGDESAFPD